MKIIKKGLSDIEVERLNKKFRQFTCETCECVFEADNTEYKHNYDQYEGDEWWTCNCPNCGRLVMDSIAVRCPVGEVHHSDPREYLDCYNEHDGR